VRPVAALLAAAVTALAVSACGGGDAPVEGPTATAPAATAPAATTTPVTTPTQTQPAGVDGKAQVARLATCLRGKAGRDLAVFAPTVALAAGQGGAALTRTVDGATIELIAFPTPAAAQQGFQDASTRLIALQQQHPNRYKAIAATATQVVGNVLFIAPNGAPPAAANARVVTCIGSSAQ
jgi:hypothetical protein